MFEDPYAELTYTIGAYMVFIENNTISNKAALA